MKKFRADLIITLAGEPVKNGMIILDDEGLVLDVLSEFESMSSLDSAEHVRGVIAPGFINSHCHLELSHTRGKIESGNGLVSFILALQKIRGVGYEVVEEAMREAENAMYNSGIVALADISNSNASFGIKSQSALVYHTFIEGFGFAPSRAEIILQGISDLKREYLLEIDESHKQSQVSLTAHAPYSVSQELFKLISKHEPGILSIHNQETEAENEFYSGATGPFKDLYEALRIPIDFYHPYTARSLPTYMGWLGNQKKLLVHNTFTNISDLGFLKEHALAGSIAFCICANSNMFIEGVLPDLNLLISSGFPLVIGTDSLASNDSLSTISEMYTIQQHYPEIKLETLLQWACLNGAEFFGWGSQLGSIEKGKKPGLVVIKGLDENLRLTPRSHSLKLM